MFRYVRRYTYPIYMHESTIANNGNAENDVKWTEAWFCICTMYMYDHCPIIILLRCSISVWTNSTPIDKCMSSICIYTQMIDVYVRFIQRARIRSRIIEFVWILSIVQNRSVVAWLIFNTSMRLKWVWDVQFPLSSRLFYFMYACLVRVICDTLNILSYIYSINTSIEQIRIVEEKLFKDYIRSMRNVCWRMIALFSSFAHTIIIICNDATTRSTNTLEHHHMNRVIEDVK